MAMQGVSCWPLAGGEVVAVAATAAATSAAAAAGAGGKKSGAALSIDGAEPPEERIERLILENPVLIFSRQGCCMCHVMKHLLATVGVHPTVIELEEAEETAAAASAAAVGLPALFIGGSPVGGLKGLIGLHLSGLLVPRLREVGALWG
ncbi:glutaredoxin-C7-like [Phoenix dactylifera]|uniref:Glutaredoxin-C7-like n=1 Tax=Phoenix dactylifera TaxID=42345 RepID=A0A8B9AHZ2_PHODC|nr:glutaredoxin-C7-like [Phoenix dactylifera]